MTDSVAKHLLAQVEKSPAAVAVHDKQAWLSIFAAYHIVEDPVGSAPHIGGLYDAKSGQRGNAALSRFFDTFIAPNHIRFEVERDYVHANHVVRDLTIHISMSDKVQVSVPMCLLYELAEEDGEWRIVRLAAHWELLPMIGQLLGKGMACLPVLAGLSLRMLTLQGIGGMLGFSKAALGVGGKGKARVEAFAEAFNNKQLADVMAVFASDAPMIHWPYGSEACYPSRLLDQVDGRVQFSKLLAAGDIITARVSWQQTEQQEKAGVAIFEFNKKSKKISGVKLYFDAV